MSDKQAAMEFLRGVLMVVGSVVFIGFLLVLFSGTYSSNTSFKPEFTVVAQYKGCDVVRMAPTEEGKFSYFLDCR